jgi:GEVED domain/Secretion system C-terminal sorting domain
MNKNLLRILFFTLVFDFVAAKVKAQCPIGYTQAQTNWDYLDYYYNSGLNIAPYGYSLPNGNYVSNAFEQTQRIAIGPNSFSLVTSAAGIVRGENATHTGNIAGYTGMDAQYTPTANGQTITITFATPVLNASFTLYDIDVSAVFNVTAADPVAVPLIVSATPQAPTILTIIGAVGKTITANATALANNDNRGTVTIAVAGTVLTPVKSITITVTTIGTDPIFWLSDIYACVTGSFTTNWHQGFNNQPFTGFTQNQPDYFIVTPDNNSAYMMDPATARCWHLFTDASKTYMNSFAYDPNNKYLYYISENVSLDRNNKTLKRYDFNTETTSVVLADITTALGLATFNAGVESAGAAIHDGKLYIGIEGGQFSSGNPRESMIWRIDFDATQNPIYSCQVYSTPSYNGIGNIIHDWADFLVKDGMVINYNSARVGGSYANSSYTHFNMMTGAATVYMNPSPGQKYSGQAGMDWAGNMYMIYDSLWQYSNGVISNKIRMSVIAVPGDPAPPAWVGNAGDGSDPFRPKCDFGDAPATYDPNANMPAVHERSELIRLGATWDREWLKRGVSGTDDVDDGLAWVPIMAPGSGLYFTPVSVYNNNGSNATVCAWLDFNANGVFDASEAITPITVPSSASSQNINLFWPSYTTPLVNGQSTYLRIRITSAAAGMTTAHATGYFTNGEVEDYRVLVDNFPLSVTNLSFDAKLVDNSYAKLNWSAYEENNFSGYEIEKSKDSRNWESAGIVASNGQAGQKQYEFNDFSIYTGTTYYRLKLIGEGGPNKYSEIRTVKKVSFTDFVLLKPNPVTSMVNIDIEATENTTANIMITNIIGINIFSQRYPVRSGTNTFNIPVNSEWPSGMYIVSIFMNNEVADKKLIIQK